MTEYFLSLRAEWLKIIHNYKFNAFLVWILPIGMLAFYCFMIIGGLLTKAPPEELVYGCGGQWTDNLYNIWNFIIASPGSIFGRILPLAFFAVVFAGEYQWGTWKNLVPRSRRMTLLLSKAGAALLAVILSILITAPISAGGQAILCRVGGAAFGPALGEFSFAAVLRDFTLRCLIGVLALAVVLGFASLSSVLTRSILGGFLGGFGLSLMEVLSLGILVLLSNIFDKPEILNAYQFTPAYNIENLQGWFFQGQPFLGELLDLNIQVPVAQSLAVLIAWSVIPFLITLLLFQKQDLTN